MKSIKLNDDVYQELLEEQRVRETLSELVLRLLIAMHKARELLSLVERKV